MLRFSNLGPVIGGTSKAGRGKSSENLLVRVKQESAPKIIHVSRALLQNLNKSIRIGLPSLIQESGVL